MTENETQKIKDGYRNMVKDCAKLYRDGDMIRRARAFLSGCMESVMPYPVALGLCLSVFPSPVRSALSVVPIMPGSGGNAVEGVKIPTKAKTEPKNENMTVPASDPVSVEPLNGSEGVNGSVMVSELPVVARSGADIDVLRDDDGDMTIPEETRAKIAEYAAQITDISNTYISTIREGDLKNPPSWFPDMIYYIVDRIEKPKHDIYLLDGLWQIYKRLCSRVGIVLMLQHFASLTSINPGTFSDWQAGQYRTASIKGGKLIPAFGETVKKWRRECEAALSAEVTGKDGANINKIFILKSCYGYTESAPVQRVEVAPAAGGAYPVLGEING